MLIFFICLLFPWPLSALYDEFTTLLDQAEMLNISRDKYTLGKALMRLCGENPLGT